MALKYRVGLSSDVRELAKDLKTTYKLTDFEALSLALKAEQNELYKIANVISSLDKHPSALESIAISLDKNILHNLE